MKPICTPDFITDLKPGEIFVFGSNLAGWHGGGAARAAFEKFGAVWGQGVGLQGQSYAIPTMQGGTDTIKPYVDQFIEFAQHHPELTFYVTRIGCGIAGFTDADIAPLFFEALLLPNVMLPETFLDVIIEKRDELNQAYQEKLKRERQKEEERTGLKQYLVDADVEILGHTFHGLADIQQHVELSLRRSRHEEEAVERTPKKQCAVHVGELWEPYPCFDWEDFVNENRTYQSYIFRDRPLTPDDMHQLHALPTRANSEPVWEQVPPHMRPVVYYRGDGSQMTVAIPPVIIP